jgi:uncharacterized membrane protein YdjX (TVP38/TMEM64 family)
MSTRQHLRRHVVLVGTLIIAAGLIAASDTLHDKTAEIILWTEGAISHAPLFGMIVFVLLAMTSAMVAFFSSAVLAGKGTCFALLWLGWLLGGIASFCIGRFLGRSVASTIVGEERIAHWESQIGARTRFVHILLFQAVVPSEIPGYVLGILRYRFVLYLTALAVTEIPYAIATVYLGESFLKGESMIFLALGIGVVIVVTFLSLRASHSIDKVS